jgi:PleD family two-component response regulator
MLLLPSRCASQAMQLLDLLHAEVRQARPLLAAPACGYTFSAGIANARAGECLDAVFRRADQALYEAKSAGRNRTVRMA